MVVALFALFVAMGGTGYAIATLPANSVGTKQLKKSAVTAKKLHKNAVKSRKVKDFSLLAKDFKLGQLPAGPKGDKGDRGAQGRPGPTFATTAMGSAGDPAANPDESSAANPNRHFDFTLPASGKLYVRFFVPYWTVGCSAGSALAGLYLDGVPIPKSRRDVSDPAFAPVIPVESVVVVAASAGSHSLEARVDCPSGNTGAIVQYPPTWTVILVGS
jgi:hypothetical protein